MVGLAPGLLARRIRGLDPRRLTVWPGPWPIAHFGERESSGTVPLGTLSVIPVMLFESDLPNRELAEGIGG